MTYENEKTNSEGKAAYADSGRTHNAFDKRYYR